MTSDERATTDGESLALAPWQTRPLPWLRRFVMLRFAALVPLVGLALMSVSRGSIDSPTGLIVVVLGAAGANLLFFLLSRRLRDQSEAGPALLFASLLLDCVLLVAAASFVGSGADSLVAFLVLPVLGAALAMSERATTVLAGAAVMLLLFVPSGPSETVALARTIDSRAPAVVEESAGAALGTAVLLATVTAAVLWYRRRGRYLEERVARLEAERHRTPAAAARVAPPVPELRPSASELRPSASEPQRERRLIAVAGVLGDELREPTDVVRVCSENVRTRLQDHQEMRSLLPDLDRVLRAADRLDDSGLALAALGRAPGGNSAATDLRAVALDVKGILQSELDRHGVRVRVDGATGLPAAAASDDEVRLVLFRLLDAVRRTAESRGRTARVLVRLLVDGDAVVVSMRDPLPSPPIEDDWFDPAYSPVERPGIGLALAMARAVAEGRGGSVTAAQTSKRGLSVRVTLPIAAAAPGAVAPTAEPRVSAKAEPNGATDRATARPAARSKDRSAIRAAIRAVIRDAV